MKNKTYAAALLIGTLLLSGIGAAAAQEKPAPPPAAAPVPAPAGPAPSPRQVDAKLTYCKTCHGLSAQGYHGYLPVPRLAGQPIDYVENQLHAFIEHRRVHPIMQNVAGAVKPEMIHAFAEHFHGLNPKPLGGAPRGSVEDGRKIYQEGIPGKDVPPCASCHGPEAKGDGQFPRLAGQLQDYILNKLKNWNKERGLDPNNPDTSAIMEPITHGLNDQQIKAVAAYLSNHE